MGVNKKLIVDDYLGQLRLITHNIIDQGEDRDTPIETLVYALKFLSEKISEEDEAKARANEKSWHKASQSLKTADVNPKGFFNWLRLTHKDK